MAQDRKKLHKILEDILGTKNVYFQPPENIKIGYPCIIYSQSGYDIDRADNTAYRITPAYTIMYVSKKYDTTMVPKILTLLNGRFDTSYISDNLYHYVITIFF